MNLDLEFSEKIIIIMNMLMKHDGCVISCGNENKNAISVAYEISDLKYFYSLLNWYEKLDIFSNNAMKKLLLFMIEKKDWLNIKLLLEKAIPNQYEDKFIMYLANALIKANQIELAYLAIEKCTNRNFIFNNGETFLTASIKEKYDESIIIQLIKRNFFDINQENGQNQTVLSLAKDSSLLNLVDLVSKRKFAAPFDILKTETENTNHNLTKNNYNRESKSQISFFTKEIPIKDRIFQDIKINRTVKYYHQTKNGIVDLFGKVVWTGIDKHGTYFYGLELENEQLNATDGTFDGQKLFQCKPHCGVLADIRNVILDTRIKPQEPETIEIVPSEDSSCLVLSLSFPIYEGLKCGIQGNISTSFFDSLLYGLFVKSDILHYIIDSITNDLEISDITMRFRSVFAFKVIYSLRQYGYVSFDKLEEMQFILKDYGQKYENFIKDSNIENSLECLSKLCPGEQLLSLISYNNYKSNIMYIQLLGRFSEFILNINSQEMLDMSMVNNEIMFNTLPSCLILSIPMDNRQEFDSIDFIPLNVIDISQVCIVYFKKCKLCANKATRQCRKCIEKSKFIIKNGFYCDFHQCAHRKMLKLPSIDISSRSKCKLILKSIICFDKNKYVAFVKEDELKNRWFRFDNCNSDKETNNYNSIPKVKFSEEVTKFFSLSDKEMIADSASYSRSDVRLILRQTSVLIYNNPLMSCY